MLLSGMHTDLNKMAQGLSPDEERFLLKASVGRTLDAQADLLRYFGRVKKQAQVFEWILTGEVKIVNFDPKYRVIELKSKDGRCHRVELF